MKSKRNAIAIARRH